MEAIIQQIALKFIEQVFESLNENGIGDIGRAIKGLSEITCATTLQIVQAVIEQADAALLAAKAERKKDGLRVKERNVPRTLLTDLGELRYTRTYYETNYGERRYLLDHLIGVEPYERLSKELCATLVNGAAEKSMSQAAKGLFVEVSRQTVDNKVLALKEVAVEAVRVPETPKQLHIFADEDHVHMKDGRSVIVPLVTVTEGIDASKKRHKTINPVHFVGYGIDNNNFFEGIASFLYEKYHMDRVDTVFVHSDGGKWIRAADDWLPNVKFVMDGFHFEKRLKRIARIKGAAAYAGVLRKAIGKDDVKRFISCCARIRQKTDERGCEVLTDNENFIRNHWDAVVLRISGAVCGSCTEPLISHILSSRLSRNPLAWSEHGIRQMAMLRVYVKNGGVITSKDIRVSRKMADLDKDKAAHRQGFAKYRAYADKQIDDFLKRKLDWSVFESLPFHYGKLDATSVLLKAWSQVRNLLASA